jgi:hypothetical protein
VSDETLPARDYVARRMLEDEAFEHAVLLYQSTVTAQTSPVSAEIVSHYEQAVFHPACELQLAGLSLLSGRDFPHPQAVVVSLACFTIDHLLCGWTAAVQAQPRVALTLSRAAIESSIFAIAAAEDFDAFDRVWNSRKGTGGHLLNSVQRVPRRVKVLLEEAWKSAVPLGHASVIPVMATRGTFLDDLAKRLGISFAGQYAGPLDASLLENLARLYCLAAVVAVEAMNAALTPLFGEPGRWLRMYEGLRSSLEVRSPVPSHLEPYIDEILAVRKRGGGGGET